MKKKILIVDDEDQNREILAEVFEDNYDIAEACSGEDGLAKYLEFNPDVILLDIMMPGMDGRKVLETIRKMELEKGIFQGSGVPIVMLTAHSGPWFESFELGCTEYIMKPFEAAKLVAQVESVLENSKYKAGEGS
ncbi:MAG: response regulator [Candidatus Omnitrophica bacterium]|nr:response regulator [Candidatus Omnitrophota bacterium]